MGNGGKIFVFSVASKTGYIFQHRNRWYLYVKPLLNTKHPHHFCKTIMSDGLPGTRMFFCCCLTKHVHSVTHLPLDELVLHGTASALTFAHCID